MYLFILYKEVIEWFSWQHTWFGNHIKPKHIYHISPLSGYIENVLLITLNKQSHMCTINLCYMCQAEKEQRSSVEGLSVPGYLLIVHLEDEQRCLGGGLMN